MTPPSNRLRSVCAALAVAVIALSPHPAAYAAGTDGPVAPHGEGLHVALPKDEAARHRPAVVTGEVTTKRFRILHTRHSEGAARTLAGRIENVRDDFQRVLGRDWPGVTEIRLGVGRQEMEALALPGGKPPAWAAAIAYPGHNIMLLDALSLVKPEGEVTLRHELSHVALGQLSDRWPRWFQEGVAMYLTGDRFSVSQYSAMFRAVTTERLFLFDTLTDDWPDHPGDVEIAYAQSVIFVSWMANRYGPDRFGALIDHVQSGSEFETAYAVAFQATLSVDEEAWRKTLANRYSWTPIVTGGTAFWGLISLLTVVAWFRRRRVQALKMAELAAQDAAEDAATRLSRAMQSFPPAEDGRTSSDPDDGVPWDNWHGDEEPSDAPERAAADDELPSSSREATSSDEADELDRDREAEDDRGGDEESEDDAPEDPPDKTRRTLH